MLKLLSTFIGTNIAATARMSDEDFNRDDGARDSIFTRNAPKSQQEMGDLFKVLFAKKKNGKFSLGF